MAVNYRTPVGKVRLLTADLSEPPLVEDAVLEGYLALYGWDETDYLTASPSTVWRAAADVLDAMATSETLLSRKVRTQDLSTDGPAVAGDLRKKAYELRRRADREDSVEGFFGVVPFGAPLPLEGEEARW